MLGRNDVVPEAPAAAAALAIIAIAGAQWSTSLARAQVGAIVALSRTYARTIRAAGRIRSDAVPSACMLALDACAALFAACPETVRECASLLDPAIADSALPVR